MSNVYVVEWNYGGNLLQGFCVLNAFEWIINVKPATALLKCVLKEWVIVCRGDNASPICCIQMPHML